MKVSFRQGIVQYQPAFLTYSGGTVSLAANEKDTLIAFAHGGASYLFTEPNSVNGAWGPFTQDSWLYWDINLVSGTRTFGHTILAPVTQASPPLTPVADQHWFDTRVNQMKVFNGANWIAKVRVFAAKLAGTSLVSMGSHAPAYSGTQVGLVTPTLTGALMYDSNGSPIKKQDGTFFTTEDTFTSGISDGALLKNETKVMDGIASVPLAAFTVVQFDDFDSIAQANPANVADRIFGVITDPVNTGEVARVQTDGIIQNTAWSWPKVNQLLYIDSNGAITTSQTIPDQAPIAIVIGRQEIILRAPKMLIGDDGDVGPATDLEDGLVRLSLAADDPLDPIVVGGNDPRLTDARAPLAHSHGIDELSDVDTTTAAPTVDQALIWNGSNWVPGDAATTETWIVRSGAYTAVDGDNIAVDTSGGAFAITLPATPTIGESIVGFSDYGDSWDTNPMTILRNGNLIEGLAEDLIVDVLNLNFKLIYVDAIKGWIVNE